MITSHPLRALWIAVALQLLGRLLDLRWHVANDEFEGTAQQFEAHWLLWIGVAATIAVAYAVLRDGESESARRGLILTVVSGALYVAVAIWHFAEHANGADPELAHVLLGLTQLGMVVGAGLATLAARGIGLRRSGPA
jgi:hypothetical protein